MPIQTRDTITQREVQEYEWQKEMFDKEASVRLEMKRLEIEASKIESKITAWFKLPLSIVRLPVTVFLALAVGIYAIRGIEPPENVLKLLK